MTESGGPLDAGLGAQARLAAPVTGRWGVLGGTFDPIHHGHLAIAEAARDELGLERVLFVPAGQPPHRPQAPGASAEHRAAMVGLAIEGAPTFALSRLELDRQGPSYTVDTLTAMAASAPAGTTPDLWFILSAEAFADFPTWHEAERVLGLCRLVVLPRDGHPAPDLRALVARLPALAGRVALLDGPRIRLSASEIRKRAAAGLSVRYLVPDAVAAYIADHRLYRDADRATRIAGGTSAP
ncbi:MAG TPA: nicotinate-nucleotide adenylyltransferase [Candidatus Limnocylindrales bacterium]